MDFITFGRFGREEHWKRDKGLFLTRLKELISELTKNEVSYEKENEIEIARNLKQILNSQNLMLDIHLVFLCYKWDYLIKF